MSKDIITPESNEYRLLYELMIQSLKTNDVKEGVNNSLHMLREYLDSGNIALFRKKSNKQYVFRMSDSNMKELIYPMTCMINKMSPLAESKKVFHIDLDLSDRIKNVTLIHGTDRLSKTDKEECLLVILNTNKEKEIEPLFYEKLKDTLDIVFKRAVSYERNTNAITKDILTGLDNRNSYDMKMQKLNENDNKIILAIFDLFRLKYVNDNYTHQVGDKYIKEAAKILNKYWPKHITKINDDGTESLVDTGHCVYRIGGDEFVLLTDVENIKLASKKAELAKEESKLINLGLEEDIPVGLNYGVIHHSPGDFIKTTFEKADRLLQIDKECMYKEYKLERRK